MKNVIKAFGLIVLAAIIGVSMMSCGGGGGGGTPTPPAPSPTSTVFESEDDSNRYILFIEAPKNNRAAFNPKNGDSYTLTIILKTTGATKTSSGTVLTVSGTILTLSGGNNLKVTIEISSDVSVMKGMTGTIITDTGETIQAPVSLTSVKTSVPKKWDLHPSWGGDSWDGNIELNKITMAIPKKGDTFRFKISGTPDKTLEKFGIGLISYTDGWSDSQWLGGSSRQVKVSGPFEEIFEITVLENYNVKDPNVKWNIDLSIANNVPFPSNVSAGGTETLATISNFELRFIGVK